MVTERERKSSKRGKKAEAVGEKVPTRLQWKVRRREARSLSLTFLHMALQWRGGSRCSGNNNCAGNYSIKCPIHPQWQSPSSSPSLPSLEGGRRAVWAVYSVTRSSGRTSSHLAESRGNCEHPLWECCGGLGLCPLRHEHPIQRTTPDLKPHNKLETARAECSAINRKRKEAGRRSVSIVSAYVCAVRRPLDARFVQFPFRVNQPLDGESERLNPRALMAALCRLCAKKSDFPAMQHSESQIGRAVRATCQAVHLRRGVGQKGWILGITELI